jgi:F0F1-type ATP synthase assembly protein I
MFDYRKNRPWLENLTVVTQLGLTMAGCILFCFYVGYRLDGWLGTRGIFVTVFILLGIVGGAVVVYRQIMEALQDKDRKKGPENGNH